jgi:transposase
MEVLLLKSFGLSHCLIAAIVDICPNTVRSYLEEYQDGGIAQLQEINFYAPTSALSMFKGTLESHFREHPPATLKEASTRIEEITGIKRGLTQVRKFILSLGLKRRKTGSIPAKADVEVQKIFRDEKLEPMLKKAREGKVAVFFVDAAHFVHAPFQGFLWCFARIFTKAPSGRKRFNVLGAINAVSHKLITITNETYINSLSVCDLLVKIAEQGLNVPITLVLDNARYQKCHLVAMAADYLQIELLFLPSYSPNLNLIERLWKFVKKQCLNSRYHPDFLSFHTTIANCLDDVHLKHKKDLDSLLTHKFQTFEPSKIAA